MSRSPLFRPTTAALWLLGAVLTACGGPPYVDPVPNTGTGPGTTAVYAPTDSFTATWRLQDAFKIRPQSNTTAPTINGVTLPRNDQITIPGYYVWDTWPLVGTDNQIAKVDGYYVLFMLSVPKTLAGKPLLPGKRHDVATIRFVYSKDGLSWKDGGYVFDNPAGLNKNVVLGSRNWAGSALLKDGKVYLYYTATGNEGEVTAPQSLPARQLTVPVPAGQRAGVEPQSCTYGCTTSISFRQRLALAVGTLTETPAA
jgi:levansucrase